MISFKEENSIQLDDVFRAGGLIASSFTDYEPRAEQLQMAKAIMKAFKKPCHLAVEAGTGTGKSFAYLVCALQQAVENGVKAVISTHTINLQEQLINKDIPFLAKVLPYDFTAALAKGRSNYLCLRRLDYAMRLQQSQFDEFSADIININDWAQSTEDGSISDIPMQPAMQAWDAVKSEHGNCKGRKCARFRDCFYWRARRVLETADVIIANHALLFSDLALKEQGVGVLPEYQYLIIDEAHNIESVAEDHFGINISNLSMLYLLNGLYKPRGSKGLLAHTNNHEAIDLVSECREAMNIFFAQVQSWYDHSYAQSNGRCDPDSFQDNITEPLKKLRTALNRIIKNSEDEDEKLEFTRFTDRLKAIEQDLKVFIHQPQLENENIFWVEINNSRSRKVTLRSAPINVGPDIKRCLFDIYPSVITTSATLSCGGKDKEGFKFFADRVGLEDFEALQLGSPFDYESQVTLHIEASLPEPNSPKFKEEAIEAVKKYLTKTDGKAFLLFTSYSMLRSFAEALSPWLAENDIQLLQQGAGIDRSTLLQEFKMDTNSVLLGTDSFWQGVDVPGESLSNVIIVRLPFAVPNHPLIQGRIEKIRREGHQPFFEYQLPSAIIKFKQGFGRLIRKKNDKGIVVVLDSRIVTKAYGKKFLEAIPRCRIEVDS